MPPQAQCWCSLCKLIDLKSFFRYETRELQRSPATSARPVPVRYKTGSDTRLHRHQSRVCLERKLYISATNFGRRWWFWGRWDRPGRERWWWCVAQSNRLKNKMCGVALHPRPSYLYFTSSIHPIKVLLVGESWLPETANTHWQPPTHSTY